MFLAVDNCPGVILNFEEVYNVVGGCGEIIRTWTAKDACGNETSATQVITVVDSTPPLFTFVPKSFSVECNQRWLFGTPVATDDCGEVTITSEDVKRSGPCPQAYSVTRIWTAADECGNSSTASQTITIEDTTAPEIVCPVDVTIECHEDSSPRGTGMAKATDNCDPDVSITFSDVVTPDPTCPDAQIITRTWDSH